MLFLLSKIIKFMLIDVFWVLEVSIFKLYSLKNSGTKNKCILKYMIVVTRLLWICYSICILINWIHLYALIDY